MSYYKPVPFVIIATSRSGGVMLCNCLDSHWQVACERDSPLDSHSPWNMWLERQEDDLLHALWARAGYRAAGFKLSYRQARHVNLDWLVNEVDGRVIHLHRRNVVRQTVSSYINTAVRDGKLSFPHHTFECVPAVTVYIDPAWFVDECHRLTADVEGMLLDLQQRTDQLLAVTYADLVGEEGAEISALPEHVAWSMCSWLGVEPAVLVTDTRRVNRRPLSEIVENWADVRAALVEDGTHAEFLEGVGL